MRRFILFGCLMCALGISGCAASGKQIRLCAVSGEVIQFQLDDMTNSRIESVGENLFVSVADFQDTRPPSQHLGSHLCLFTGEAYFDLMGEDIGQGVAKVFLNFLKKADFQVTSGSNGAVSTSITGKIIKFSINATRQFLSTKTQIDIIMEFTIANKVDGSTVRMIINAGGTNKVLFFAPEDMEGFVNEILQESFEEFLEKIEVKGKSLREKI